MKVEFSAFPKAFAGNVAVFVGADKQLLATAQSIDAASGGAVVRAFEGGRFTGAKGQTLTVLGHSGDVARLLLLGVGKGKELDGRAAEGLGGVIAAEANAAGHTAVTVVVDPVKGTRLTPAQIAAHIALGVRLRSYRFDKYKTKDKPEQKLSLQHLTIVLAGPADARKAYAQLEPVVDAVFLTRDLVSEPPNVLYPVEFARRARELTKLGVKVEVLGEAEMKKLGMETLLAVGQGSGRDSQLLVMTWMNGPKGQAPVALIGKGVCFDTGGISLKPAGGMEDMKWDMGGAGAVTGAMALIAGRKAKANVVAVCALVENMPDGNAQRPGDVVKSMSGQTVEVINTDAEGRLILCDAMWYAQEKFKPQAMVELSTLTGAIIVALGHERAGLFCNNTQLSNRLRAAGAGIGEKLWRMPLGPKYDKLIDSEIADMRNVGGGRDGGSITAAQFLQRFVQDGVAWAHIDIAGVAWSGKGDVTTPKGATAYGVRLLDRLIAENYER
ncbi:leucyl aminopeptidase [Reyranella sp. MMS21-HV4-11]|jgi:leucyl aminopeptidase|uniref:Probable cytosol aminopeptidase n=1 Tax=Reyranella humidisoli TaxID=2849149 RepID=A0ABS6ILW5_9HYPH|nr:leucyl aminopeptidase [Reyranella sp. MMS21-HV4-11]MBU8875576.1 leucyl aminopeptidase [Reyranella sp. MMS21-HV4-11]